MLAIVTRTHTQAKGLQLRLLASCAMATSMISAGAVQAAAPGPPPLTGADSAFQGIGTVVSGIATIIQTPTMDTITVATPQTVINFTPFDTANGGGPITFLPSGRTGLFQNDPNSGVSNFTVLNRIIPTDATRAIRFDGTVQSRIANATGGSTPGGTILFYSPGGIIASSSAVFDVGSLVLSAADIGFGAGSNSFSFSGAAAGTAVDINAGASILAQGVGSYVALVAPRVVQSGSVRSDGSVGYIAAEAVDVTIQNNLFDISFVQGTDSGAAVTHTGSTELTRTPNDTSPQRIYVAAVPKNDAITTLISGSLGYSAATSASVRNGAVILSAGRNVSNSGYGASFTDFAAGAAPANITIGADGATVFNASLLTNATGDALIVPAAGTTIQFNNSVTLNADRLAEVRAVATSSALFNAGLSVSSNNLVDGAAARVIALGETGYGGSSGLISVIGNLIVDGGPSQGVGEVRTPVSLLAADLGRVNVSGSATVKASDADAMFARNAFGGSATVRVGAAGSQLSAAGLVIDAGARGVAGLGGNEMPVVGNATGGTANLILGGGTFAPINISFDSSAVSDLGGVATGGTASLVASGGVVGLGTILANVSASAVQSGDTGTGPEKERGTAFVTNEATPPSSTGGTIQFDVTDTVININGDLLLNASASGSEGYGALQGGTIAINANNGSLLIGDLISANVSAEESASALGVQPGEVRGGTITALVSNNGDILASAMNYGANAVSGGDTFGGAVSLTTSSGGRIRSTGTIGVDASAMTRGLESAGDAIGGNIVVNINSGSLQSGPLVLDANALGGEAIFGGIGGSAVGGSARVNISGGDSIIESFRLTTDATGGRGGLGNGGAEAGGAGGAATAGTSEINISSGVVRTAGLVISSLAIGGNGGEGALGGAGGTAMGGQANVLTSEAATLFLMKLPINPAPTPLASSVNSSARGGSGGLGHLTSGGAGGAATGGTSILTLAGADIQPNSPRFAVDLTVNSEASGGLGGTSNGADAGAGGSAIGGTATLNLVNNHIDFGNIALSTRGSGGSGGSANNSGYGTLGTGGAGGNGSAGMASVTASAPLTNIVSTNIANLAIAAEAVGGSGGNGAVGGNGGNALNTGSASFTHTAGAITSPIAILTANSFGGRGGDGFDGNGGNGGNSLGGTSRITANGATANLMINVAGVVAVAQSGIGGNAQSGGSAVNGGNAGNATGGTAELSVSNGAALVSGTVTMSANAMILGSDGGGDETGPTGSAANGGMPDGTATGGTVSVNVNNATVLLTQTLELAANGEAQLGTAQGGTVNIFATGGTLTTPSTIVTANGSSLVTGTEIGGRGGIIDIRSQRAANGTAGVLNLGSADLEASGFSTLIDAPQAATNAAAGRINIAANGGQTTATNFSTLSARTLGRNTSGFNPNAGIFLTVDKGAILANSAVTLLSDESIAVSAMDTGNIFVGNNLNAEALNTIAVNHSGRSANANTILAGNTNFIAGNDFNAMPGSRIRSDNDLTITSRLGGVSAGDLVAGDDIAVSANGLVNITGLAQTTGITAGSGTSDIIIDAGAGVTIANANAQSSLVVRGTSITGTDLIAGEDIALRSPGDIMVTSGMAGDDIDVTTTGGSITLGSVITSGLGADNRRASFDSGIIAFGAETFARSNILANAVTGISVTSANARDTLGLRTDGSISAATLIAGEDATFASSGNTTITTVTAGDDIDLNAAGAITVLGATSTGNGADDRRVFLPVGSAFFTGENLTRSNIIAFSATAVTLGSPPASMMPQISAAASLAVRSDGTITASNIAAGEDVALSSSGDISVTTARSGDDFSALSTSGDITLTGITTNATGADDRAVNFGYGTISFGATAANGSDIDATAGYGTINLGTLDAANDLTVSAQAIAALAPATLVAGQDISLTGQTSVSVGDATTGRDFSLTSNGSASVVNVTAGDDIIINALGAVSATGSLLTTGLGSLSSDSDIEITTPAAFTFNAISALSNFRFSSGSLSGNSILAGNSIAITADSASSNAATTTTGNILVNARAVSLGNTNAGLDLIIDTQGAANSSITLGTTSAARDIRLSGGTNGISATSLTAGDDIDVTGSGSVSVTNALTNGSFNSGYGGDASNLSVTSSSSTVGVATGRAKDNLTLTATTGVTSTTSLTADRGAVIVNGGTSATLMNTTATLGAVTINADAVNATNVNAATNIGVNFGASALLGTLVAGNDVILNGTGNATIGSATAMRDINAMISGDVVITSASAGRNLRNTSANLTATTLGAGTDVIVITDAAANLGTATAGARIVANAGTDISFTQLMSGTTTSLVAGTAITGGNANAGTALTLNANGGAAAFGMLSSGASTSITASSAITGNSANAGGALTLNSGANGITATTLTSGSGNNLTVTASNGGNATITTATSGRDLSVNATAVSVATGSAARDVLYTAASNIIAGATSAGRNVALNAVGTINATTTTAAANIVANSTGNASLITSTADNIFVVSTGDVTLGTANATTMLGVNAQNISGTTLAAGEDIRLIASGTANVISASAGDDVDISATNGITLGNIIASGASRDDRSLAFNAPAFAIVSAPADGSDIRLTSNGAVNAANLDAGDDIRVDSGDFTLTGLARTRGLGITDTGSDVVINGDAVTVAMVNAASNLSVNSETFVGTSLIADGAISVITSEDQSLGTADAAQGPITGNSTRGTISFVDLSTGGDINLNAGDAIAGGSADAGGSIQFAASNGVNFDNLTSGGSTNISGGASVLGDNISADGDVFVGSDIINLGSVTSNFASIFLSGRDVTVGTAGARVDFTVDTGKPANSRITLGDVIVGRDILLTGATNGLTATSLMAGDDIDIDITGNAKIGLAITDGSFNGGYGDDGYGDDTRPTPIGNEGYGGDLSNITLNAAQAMIGTARARNNVTLTTITGTMAGTVIADQGDILINGGISANIMQSTATLGSITINAGTVTADRATAGDAFTVNFGGNASLGTVNAGSMISVTGTGNAAFTSLTSGNETVIMASGSVTGGTSTAGGLLSVMADNIDVDTLTSTGSDVVASARIIDIGTTTAARDALIDTKGLANSRITLGTVTANRDIGLTGGTNGITATSLTAGDDIDVVGSGKATITNALTTGSNSGYGSDLSNITVSATQAMLGTARARDDVTLTTMTGTMANTLIADRGNILVNGGTSANIMQSTATLGSVTINAGMVDAATVNAGTDVGVNFGASAALGTVIAGDAINIIGSGNAAFTSLTSGNETVIMAGGGVTGGTATAGGLLSVMADSIDADTLTSTGSDVVASARIVDIGATTAARDALIDTKGLANSSITLGTVTANRDIRLTGGTNGITATGLTAGDDIDVIGSGKVTITNALTTGSNSGYGNDLSNITVSAATQAMIGTARAKDNLTLTGTTGVMATTLTADRGAVLVNGGPSANVGTATASQGSVTITAGNINAGTVAAGTNANFNFGGTMTVGTVTAGNSINVNGTGPSVIISQRDVIINQAIAGFDVIIDTAGLPNSRIQLGNVAAARDISLSGATNGLSATSLTAGDDIDVVGAGNVNIISATANGMFNSGYGEVADPSNLNITANSGTITLGTGHAKDNVTLTTTGGATAAMLTADQGAILVNGGATANIAQSTATLGSITINADTVIAGNANAADGFSVNFGENASLGTVNAGSTISVSGIGDATFTSLTSGGATSIMAGDTLIGGTSTAGGLLSVMADSIDVDRLTSTASNVVASARNVDIGTTSAAVDALIDTKGLANSSITLGTVTAGRDIGLSGGTNGIVATNLTAGDDIDVVGSGSAVIASALTTGGSNTGYGDSGYGSAPSNITLSATQAMIGTARAKDNVSLTTTNGTTATALIADRGAITVRGGTLAMIDSATATLANVDIMANRVTTATVNAGTDVAIAYVSDASLGAVNAGTSIDISGTGSASFTSLTSGTTTRANVGAALSGGAINAGTSLNATAGGAFTTTGPITAGTSATITGGSITTANATAGGALSLTANQGAIRTSDLIGGTGVQLRGSSSATIGNITASANNVDIALASGLTGGNVTAANNIMIANASGAVSAGALSADNNIAVTNGGAVTLASAAGSDITLASTANAINVSTVAARGALTGTAATALTLGTATAGSIIALTGQTINAATLTAATNITGTASGAMMIGSARATGGNLTLNAAGALSVTTGGALGDVRLTSTSSGNITSGTLSSGSAFMGGTTGGMPGAGDIVITSDGNAMMTGNSSAGRNLNVTARNLISVGGVANGTAIDLRSTDIAVNTTSGRIGEQGRTTLAQLTNTGTGVTTVGGAGVTTGYSLSNAEAQRIFAGDIIITAARTIAPSTGTVAALNDAAPDVVLDALTLTGATGQTGATAGNIGATGRLRIETPGKLRTVGAVAISNLASANRFQVNAAQSIEVDAATGSVSLSGAGGALSGSIELTAPSVIAASLTAIGSVAAAADGRAISDRLAINDNAISDVGTFSANSIIVNVSNGFFVQNSGIKELSAFSFGDRRGITVGAGGLTINAASAATRIFVSGRQLQTNGSFITGIDFLRAQTINGTRIQLSTFPPTPFDPASTVNGCAIISASTCLVTIDGGSIARDVIGQSDDDSGGSSEGNGSGNNDFVRFEFKALDASTFAPVIDDPVTGVGNDDLWALYDARDCTDDQNLESCAKEEASPEEAKPK